MLYLDYAKPLADGKYILSFFADSVADLESISHGQKFVTKNGTDYGVPQAGSTVIVTSPNSGKTTYVMDAEGVWVVTEDISYSAVVANPSDAATAKLEKLKVNDTTYANWTENEIRQIASEAGGGVQADYNQNDSAAADYIKNRPFYEGIIAVLEQTFSTHPPEDAPEENLNVWETTDSKIPFVEGETVKVLFNGTEYTQTVKKKFGDVLYIGNMYIFTKDAAENTGEPFAVANTVLSTLKDGITIMTEQPQTNATIKVEKIGVKKMQAKYLPDGTATETYVDTAISNAITKTLNTEV